VKLVIDSDAHATAHLHYPEAYGIDQARRGWASREDVLNTRPLDDFLGALKNAATVPPRERKPQIGRSRKRRS